MKYPAYFDTPFPLSYRSIPVLVIDVRSQRMQVDPLKYRVNHSGAADERERRARGTGAARRDLVSGAGMYAVR